MTQKERFSGHPILSHTAISTLWDSYHRLGRSFVYDRAQKEAEVERWTRVMQDAMIATTQVITVTMVDI